MRDYCSYTKITMEYTFDAHLRKHDEKHLQFNGKSYSYTKSCRFLTFQSGLANNIQFKKVTLMLYNRLEVWI